MHVHVRRGAGSSDDFNVSGQESAVDEYNDVPVERGEAELRNQEQEMVVPSGRLEGRSLGSLETHQLYEGLTYEPDLSFELGQELDRAIREREDG